MMIAMASPYEFSLPWSSSREEDGNYRKWLKRSLILFFIFTLATPWLPLPLIEREQNTRIVPVQAKVLIERKPTPPPAEVKVAPAPVPKAAAKPRQQAARPAPRPAQKTSSKVGVGALSGKLAALRSSLDVARLQARNTNVSTGAAARSQRSMLGRAKATATSGGISADALSVNGGNSQLAGHSSTAVSSPVAGNGSGGSGSGGGGGKRGSTVQGGRDMESIRRTFEKHKGAIYAIYNRELRKDPEIEGKFVFHIVIEPGGAISSIRLVSSELSVPVLEKKLLSRIRTIGFGSMDVAATPVTYKFEFLPS